jgi:hypothetical protein
MNERQEQSRLANLKAQKETLALYLDEIKGATEALGGDNIKVLSLVNDKLNCISVLIACNMLSVPATSNYLDQARKMFYEILLHLESIVSRTIDGPFSDYEKGLETISYFSDDQRYNLVRKIGFTIDMMIDTYGENTKWKWSFVEMQSRFAVISKNLLNLRTFVSGMDPRVEGYESRMAHLSLTKELLAQSANEYREKYELPKMQNINDMKTGIMLLLALRRLHLVLGEVEQAEQIKRKIQVWKSKLDDDLRKKR